ncbi:MAG: SUMF1/EgtB/PvdO family nonheme iron enzyme, partial [Myxococcales bacterium]|nr:SUMF1/EgtB/PvdO family nonheme iron enzyme [Myxococcales bacterium]
YQADLATGDGEGPIPAEFPKGYAGFYAMRRQVTQGEYATFISSLSGEAITYRYPYDGEGNNRFTIHRAAGGQRLATRPRRACNFLAWADGAAWACWAGLRPLSELEYEKACRGPLPALADEYAWGTTSLAVTSVLLGADEHREVASGNAQIDNSYRPLAGAVQGRGPVDDDSFVAAGQPFAHQP